MCEWKKVNERVSIEIETDTDRNLSKKKRLRPFYDSQFLFLPQGHMEPKLWAPDPTLRLNGKIYFCINRKLNIKLIFRLKMTTKPKYGCMFSENRSIVHDLRTTKTIVRKPIFFKQKLTGLGKIHSEYLFSI